MGSQPCNPGCACGKHVHTAQHRARVSAAKTFSFESVWDRIDVRGADECWPWTGYARRSGRGIVTRGGRLYYVSRIVFYLTHGQWPEPECLHECDNPACCNPAHLKEGTHARNMGDAAVRLRMASKIGPVEVDEIRVMAGQFSQREIASFFGVSQSLVSRIQSGERRSHVGRQKG